MILLYLQGGLDPIHHVKLQRCRLSERRYSEVKTSVGVTPSKELCKCCDVLMCGWCVLRC